MTKRFLCTHGSKPSGLLGDGSGVEPVTLAMGFSAAETTTEGSTFPGAWLRRANFPLPSRRLGEGSWLGLLYLFRANLTGAVS